MEKAPMPRETDTSQGEDAGATRVEPIMEAPEASTPATPDAASWNPAQGDRSFGYGAAQQGHAGAGERHDQTGTGDDAS